MKGCYIVLIVIVIVTLSDEIFLFAFVISSIKECHPISSVFSSIEIFLSKIKFTIPGSNMTLTLIDMCTTHVPSYMHFPNIDIPNPVSIVKGII